MATVAIIGAHGGIGRLLVPLLSDRGDAVVAVVRGQDQAREAEAAGARAALVDLERDDVDVLAEALEGAEAVVFSAGAGGDGSVERKRTVDLNGSLLAQSAARRAGARRFVQVSAIGVDEPVAEDASEVWRAYVEAKREADAALASSGLEHTILRPGSLSDDEGTGRVTLGTRVERGSIPRADVAALVAAALDDPSTIGLTVEAVTGETPIADALARVAREVGGTGS